MTKPINLDGFSVRAVLEGRKTQHRVVVKDQPADFVEGDPVHPRVHAEPYLDAYNGGPYWCWWTSDNRQGPGWYKCPYAVGDELWVRETWSRGDGGRPNLYLADAEDGTIYYERNGAGGLGGGLYEVASDRVDWLLPESMLKCNSRIRLRVTAVRVKRLRSVCASDAYAEGFPYPTIEATAAYHKSARAEQAIDWLRDHWNARPANKDHQWESNPWVWVVEFETV